jgi:hypothetical protein
MAVKEVELTEVEENDEEFTFELLDKDIPKSTRGGTTLYAEKVDEFVSQEKPSKYVSFTGRKPASVRIGLLKAISNAGLHDKVNVISRKDDLWLVKK